MLNFWSAHLSFSSLARALDISLEIVKIKKNYAAQCLRDTANSVAGNYRINSVMATAIRSTVAWAAAETASECHL